MNNSSERASSPFRQGRQVSRREFMVGGVKVGLSFLVFDSLARPVFGQLPSEVSTASGLRDWMNISEPTANLDDSLQIMAAYLVQYIPPSQNFPAEGAWKATYDLLEWLGSVRTAKGGVSGGSDITFNLTPQPPSGYFRRNRIIGSMTITRRTLGKRGDISYIFDYSNKLAGFESSIKSTMHCTGDVLPRLIEWETEYQQRKLRGNSSLGKVKEHGQHKDGQLAIQGPTGTRYIQTDRPVVPQWAIMDALRNIKPDALNQQIALEFDLLHDLTSYRPKQQLRPSGILNISIGRESYTLHGYLQTGVGSVPTHYWIDSVGRPLLVTGGLFCSALVSIESLKS